MRLVLHPKVSSSAITIGIYLLDPGVDRGTAELEDFRLEWVLDFNADISWSGSRF